jgi:uncharacterized protein (DUF736 family)
MIAVSECLSSVHPLGTLTKLPSGNFGYRVHTKQDGLKTGWSCHVNSGETLDCHRLDDPGIPKNRLAQLLPYPWCQSSDWRGLAGGPA